MRFSPGRRIVVAALAGAATVLTFAPFYWWWLAPVTYALLFLVWRTAPPRQAFVSGLAFGGAEFLLGTYWIVISVHGYGQAPMWLALFLMLGLVFIMALYVALIGLVAARWFRDRRAWLLLGTLPALFVVDEWLRGWLFTGFGWLSPGYSQTDSWLAGFAPVFGLLGVGWAVLLIAGALGLAVQGSSRERVIAGLAALVVVLGGFMSGRIAWTEATPGRHSVALAQGAVQQELRWRPEQLEPQLELYRSLTLEALGSDLIVWPEAAIPDYSLYQRDYLAEIERIADAAGSRIMLGILHFDLPTLSTQNAVYTLGETESIYIKRHLVPYGEYFPVPDFIRSWLRALELPNIDTEPGDPDQPPVPLRGERIAVTICYEDVFGAEQLSSFPDATLLVNVSNDAWFGDSLAAHQHLQIARMRSLEVGRWQVRATNTGVTGIIDPRGKLVARLPQFEQGVLRGSVTGMTGSTPYIVWGNWPVVLLACFVVAAALVTQGLRARKCRVSAA